MAFMCRSARVQRWSAGAAKNPLFQTPTVSGNCKGASLHTSAHFPMLHYHKMCVLTQLYSNAILLAPMYVNMLSDTVGSNLYMCLSFEVMKSRFPKTNPLHIEIQMWCTCKMKQTILAGKTYQSGAPCQDNKNFHKTFTLACMHAHGKHPNFVFSIAKEIFQNVVFCSCLWEIYYILHFTSFGHFHLCTGIHLVRYSVPVVLDNWLIGRNGKIPRGLGWQLGLRCQ